VSASINFVSPLQQDTVDPKFISSVLLKPAEGRLELETFYCLSYFNLKYHAVPWAQSWWQFHHFSTVLITLVLDKSFFTIAFWQNECFAMSQ